MKVSISPSKIEQFRLHYTDAYNGTITKEKVIEAIKGLTPWTPKMEFGGAFHTLLENGVEPYYNPVTGLYEVPVETFDKPFAFKPEEAAHAEEYRKKYPGMIHEIPASIKLLVNGFEVSMSMRIDSMDGLDIHEKKTTGNLPTRDKYEGSMQWRCYALATNCRRVVYDVWKYDEKSPRNIDKFEFEYLPYVGMRDELVRMLGLYIRFCEDEGIVEHIILNK